MNQFEQRVSTASTQGLVSLGIETIQVNVGLRCNQQCRHCHLECGPSRTEVMDWPTMARVQTAADAVGARLIDITGGAPELNPCLRRFIEAVRSGGREVQVRTNLTALLEPGQEGTIDFFRRQRVRLVASMPCYLARNVAAQRGPEVYERSIEGIRRLNAAGYGVEGGLQLDLVYNPTGPFLPPDQAALEADYRRGLAERFGVRFSRLLTITNMPLGRFGAELRRKGVEQAYLALLEGSFNPDTVEALMCRHQISVGWDGILYDCDFNLALRCPVDHGAPDHILRFDGGALRHRRIVTHPHCFGCTAGAGSSCHGALTATPVASGRDG